MKTILLVIAFSLLGGCEKVQNANSVPSDSSSTENKSDVSSTDKVGTVGAIALSDNALAQAVGPDLASSVMAFSNDTSDQTFITTLGSLAIEDSATGLALLDDNHPYQCQSTNNPVGCKNICSGGQNPPACIKPCPQGVQPTPQNQCMLSCPNSGTLPNICYYMIGQGGNTGGSGGTASGTSSGGTGGTGGTTGGGGGGASGPGCYASVDALKSATKSNFSDTSIVSGTQLDRSPIDVRKEVDQRLLGKADCVSEDLVDSLNLIKKYGLTENLDGAGCYRPDWGIIDGKFGDTDEACMVGFFRNENAKFAAYVTFSQRVVEAMICQAKVNGQADKEIEVGESIDFGDSLGASITSDNMTIKSASIARESDNGDRKSFLSKFTVTLAGKGPTGKTFPFDMAVTLSHSPGAESNDEYDGVLSISHLSEQQANDTFQYKKSLSLSYAKANDDKGARVTYELRSGEFHKAFSVIDSSGILNFNAGATFTGSGGAYGAYQTPSTSSLTLDATMGQLARRMKFVQYDGYPAVGANRMSYWVNFGESYTELARGFVFESKVVEGTIKGCGIAGSVVQNNAAEVEKHSIRKAIKEDIALRAKGFWRPFMCGQVDSPEMTGPKIWQQCFKRNEDGAYVVDTDATTDDASGFDFIPHAQSVVRPPARLQDNAQFQNVYRPK